MFAAFLDIDVFCFVVCVCVCVCVCVFTSIYCLLLFYLLSVFEILCYV